MKELVADKDRHQWFTPTWAAEILIETHFPELGENDVVAEPTCGIGTFLKAIPANVHAFGVEIDPELAETARRETGRTVLTGDFTLVDLPATPTAVIGNPPFDLGVIDTILDRCHAILPEGGKVGFILPAYAFQTASRIVEYRRKWSIRQEMIPRNLFRNMMKPLCFAVFRKDSLGQLDGFALYRELNDVNHMPKATALELSTKASPWRAAVSIALASLGGRATLDEIYAAVEPRRPTGNDWWRAKIRQTLGRSEGFRRVAPATWEAVA